MTTIVASRKHKAIAADSFNTDSSGMARLVNKIEKLQNGYYFLGSGHLKPLGLVKRWLNSDQAEDLLPELNFVTEDTEEFGFSIIVASPDLKKICILDDELEWYECLDEYVAIGSGSQYALGALDAGASPEDAIKIACLRDQNTGEPVQVMYL